MILTVDLNPSIDRIYYLDDINIGKAILAKSSSYGPGGHGIMATSLLDAFNEEVFMSGFLGGVNGEYFHRILLDLGIAHEFLPIKEEIKTKMKITESQNKSTIIYDEGPRITREEVGNFYKLFTKLVERANIVCCVGKEQPQGLPNEIYANLVEISRENRKKIILDIGDHGISSAIDAIPYMVILTKKQLENLINLQLDFENEIIKATRFILDKGIKYVVIDLEDKGSMVLEQDKGYILDIPNLERTINSRENASMAAGFAMGISRNYDIDMVLRLGQAFGVASSVENNKTIELSDIKRLMGQIEIYPINY